MSLVSSERHAAQVLSGLFALLLGTLFALLLGWPTLASSAETPPKKPAAEVLPGPASFDDCVKLALRQSPFFTMSALEIEVRRHDETDSKSDFIPALKFRTRYYVRQPSDPAVDNPLNYSIALTSEDYNPLLAYFSLKVRKVITHIATLGHLKVIAAGIQRLGQGFLRLSALERLTRLHGELAQLARENLRYAQERQKLGEITPLEVQIAAQEAEVAAAEKERLAASQAQIREGLRAFLGLKSHQPLKLNLSQARRQVLGDFEPSQASLEEAKDKKPKP